MTSLRRGLIPCALAALIAFAYWPGLYGFWGRDDFMQLAFARMIGSPWPLFVQDHYFPVPGSIFRPLGFASFWLWQALFGTDYFAHAFGDMLLHAAVGLALYRVIRIGDLQRVPALLCALVFALHPVALGTALWWSARFDLLAALCMLIALRAAFDHAGLRRLDLRRPASLLVALAAVLAALLSKETSLAVVVAIGIVWLRWGLRDVPRRTHAWRALAGLASVVVVFFAWRFAVLGTAGSGLAGDTPLAAAIGKGFADWFHYVAGYVSFWSRLGEFARIALVVVALGVIACLVLAIRQRSATTAFPYEVDLLICGVCLFLLPAVLQAPVVALNAVPLRADVSAVEAAMQSRLYYISMAGLAILLSLVVRRAWAIDSLRRVFGAMLGIAVIVLGFVSRETATEYAARTAAARPMAEAAVAAVGRRAAPDTPCHIVMLGAEPPLEWSIYVSMDAVVKALSTDPSRIGHCFISADYPTYFNLMVRGATPADAMPWTPHESHGERVPWLQLGDAVVAYLDPPASNDPATLRGVVFMRNENGVFRDVTADVIDGRLAVEIR